MGSRHVVLTVHGVGELGHRKEDGEEVTTLTTAELDTALEVIAPMPWVRLTFDDGNSSDLEIALPRLQERGMQATFFVLAGKLGQPGWLDCDGVVELSRAGMAVGRMVGHTGLGAVCRATRLAGNSSRHHRCLPNSPAGRSPKWPSPSAATTGGCSSGCGRPTSAGRTPVRAVGPVSARGCSRGPACAVG